MVNVAKQLPALKDSYAATMKLTVFLLSSGASERNGML